MSRSPGGLTSFGRLLILVMSMKGDMEQGSTPKFSPVCTQIHQPSEQPLSLTPEGCTALLLWWGLHSSVQAVQLGRISARLHVGQPVLLAGSSASGPACTSWNEDKKGQRSCSSTFLLSWGHPNSVGIFKAVMFFSFWEKYLCACFSCLQSFVFCWASSLAGGPTFLFETQAAG